MKIKIIGILCLILVLLSAPLVFSQDCGNGICDAGEDINNCPPDCFAEEEAVSIELEDDALAESEEELPADIGVPALETISKETLEEKGVSGEIRETGFFSSLKFKIILALIILATMGGVIFLIYYLRKINNQHFEASNQMPEENLSE